MRPEKLREDGINQLDSLLDDLQQVKHHSSFEKGRCIFFICKENRVRISRAL